MAVYSRNVRLDVYNVEMSHVGLVRILIANSYGELAKMY
jgi:hypothetical protein